MIVLKVINQRGWKPLLRLVGDDVDEAARDDDDLADREAIGVGLDAGVSFSEGFDFILGCVFAHHQLSANLAVDLDHDLELRFDEEFFNELWPDLLGEKGVVAELFVDLFGDVWGKWVEYLEEINEQAHRDLISLGEGVGADHHL